MKALITVYDSILKQVIFNHGAIEKLREFSEVDWVEEGKSYSSEDMAKDIHQYDACITSWGSPKFTTEVLDKAEKLKFIGHAAGTVIPIIDECIFKRDIAIVNANSCLAKSTAEATLALMMAGAWNIHGSNASLKQGQWSNSSSKIVMGLYRQVIGLIGYGDISKEVIRLLKPYHADILLYSRYCSIDEANELCVELCSLEDLLSRSRIISLHNTLTPSTIGMLGEYELGLVQDGALIVNTARGPIIDEQALLKNVKTGRISAALDVYDKEPLEKEHELLKLSNVLCLPHIGACSRYWKSRLGKTVIDDLERFVKGENLHEHIELEKFKRLTPK